MFQRLLKSLFGRLMVFSWLLAATGCASYLEQASRALQARQPASGYALVGVNLITMQAQGLRRNQTVLVQDGRIVALGPVAEVPIPAGARRLELAGRYVMPGLTDMHVHLADQRDLLLLLRYGITSVRNMAAYPWWTRLLGTADPLVLRQAVKSGELLGPDIFTCGPILEGEPPQNLLVKVVHDPDEAEAAVKETAEAGYDCVKVYNHLSRPSFERIVAIAGGYGLPVMGHVPYDVALDGALKAHMRTIEHLNTYVDNFASHYRFDEDELAREARKTREAGVYNCPTLVVWDHHPPYREEEIAKMPLDPHYKFLTPGMQMVWKLSIPGLYELTYPDKEHYPAHQLELSEKMVRILYQQGAPLLIGTDSNLTGVYPGSAALREMELFAEAGLPPQAILAAATVNAARALGREQDSGTLAVGHRADLVVLDANPLADIRNIHRIQGVMTQGRWLELSEIERMIAEAYGLTPAEAAVE